MNTKDCPTCGGWGLVAWGTCPTCDGVGELETICYCATCGEREGSEYAKHCCTDDNMIED